MRRVISHRYLISFATYNVDRGHPRSGANVFDFALFHDRRNRHVCTKVYELLQEDLVAEVRSVGSQETVLRRRLRRVQKERCGDRRGTQNVFLQLRLSCAEHIAGFRVDSQVILSRSPCRLRNRMCEYIVIQPAFQIRKVKSEAVENRPKVSGTRRDVPTRD